MDEAATSTPASAGRAPKGLLIACGALFLAASAALLAFDLDISPYRWLRNDVLFRGAPSIERIHTYPTMDPSPFSIALPTDLFVRERLLAGELPLWDRTQGGGYAPIAQGNMGVMFPLRWLVAPLPPHQSHSVFMLATLALCFAGALLWLHGLGLTPLSAALGAGLFTGSGFMLSHLFFDGVAVYLFLPWLLWAWRRWCARPSRERFAVLVGLFALSFTSGHHMLLTSVFAAVGLLAALEAGLARRIRDLAGLAAGAVWGALGAAFVLLPFAFNLQSAWNYKTDTPGSSFEVPDLSGWVASLRDVLFDRGATFLDEYAFFTHLGVGLSALALFGAWAAWREPRLRFAVPALGVAFLLCLPGPWMAPLAELPPLYWLRNIYVFVVLLAASVLTAAIGFDAAMRRAGRRVPHGVFVLVAFLLVGIGLLRGLPFFLPVPAKPIPSSEPYRLLRGDPDRFRITALWGQSHLPNISHLTGLEDLRLISVAMNPRYHTWFQLLDPNILEASPPTERVTNHLSSPLVGAFNVKYVIAGKVPHHLFLTQIQPGDVFGQLDPRVRPVASDAFRVEYEDRYLRLLRTARGYHPRAFLAETVHAVQPGMDNAASFIRDHPQALARGDVVVEAPAGRRAELDALGEPEGEVALQYPSYTRAVLHVRAERPALLVLNDTFKAGWRARIDGDPAEILPVNVLARGVLVPAGEHEVRMRYRPLGFALGCAISAGSLAALAGFVLLGRRARREDSTRPASPRSA